MREVDAAAGIYPYYCSVPSPFYLSRVNDYYEFIIGLAYPVDISVPSSDPVYRIYIDFNNSY